MERKKIEMIVTTLIILFLLLLMGLLAYSIFYNNEATCNARIEFKKISNCSSECTNNCIGEGFNPSLGHTFLGEKISISKDDNNVVKESNCICECLGCKK